MDARVLSTAKLTPPAPLPYVSRRALKRVGNDAIAPPTECPYCGGSVELVNHAEIYGREYSDWPYTYLCRPCHAYVGTHPDTDLPLGTLADEPLRAARKAEKGAFIALSKSGGMSRRESYRWLAEQLEIEPTACHWGMFTIEQCRRAGEICRAEMARRLSARS